MQKRHHHHHEPWTPWREEKGEAEPLILLYLGTRMEALLAINLVAGGAEATKDLQFF